MVKAIALLKRRPGLSPQQFRNHYEEVHAPLAKKVFPFIKKYVRNYVSTMPFSSGDEEPQFDCITEEWFDNVEGFQAMMDVWASETGRAIREDEKEFLDRRKVVYLIVEEVV